MYYQCSIYGTGLLFVNLRISDKRVKRFSSLKPITTNEIAYTRNMFIKTLKNDKIKRHKYMIIPDRTVKIERKLIVTVHLRNAYRVEFYDHLWIPLLYQLQLRVVLFAIISFGIYKYLVRNGNMVSLYMT